MKRHCHKQIKPYFDHFPDSQFLRKRLVNNNPLTDSPIHRFTHSPIHPFTILYFAFLLALSGCSTCHEAIRDIHVLPQDTVFYLPAADADRELVTKEYHKNLNDKFDAIFFHPWRRSTPYYSKEVIVAKHDKYLVNPGYGENKQPHAKDWAIELIKTADIDNYPNAGFRAITVANSDLRELPTVRPHFNDFELAGEGYPFDNLQYSAIPANTPIFISHISRDKSWALAESHYGVGWLPWRDIALVDRGFTEEWETGRYISFVKDEVPVVDQGGVFRFKAPLGSVFPFVGEESDGFVIRVATVDENSKAILRIARISKRYAAAKPLELTMSNIAGVANELINEPYGWGGMYQNRDCSSMIKDLFAPFGLWLPRNSGEQARTGGLFISLADKSPEEKEKIISEQGIPYLSLLWFKGHIMLYIGSHQGRLLVFHNTWGIKTKDHSGREGRKIVGKAAVTTLHLGAELPDIDMETGDLLQKTEGMVLLIPEARSPGQ